MSATLTPWSHALDGTMKKETADAAGGPGNAV